MLLVRSEARVTPVSVLCRTFMFAAPCHNLASGFSYILFACSRAFKTVDPALLVLGWVPFVFGAEYILKLDAWLKGHVATRFAANAFKFVGQTAWDVWKTQKRFAFRSGCLFSRIRWLLLLSQLGIKKAQGE